MGRVDATAVCSDDNGGGRMTWRSHAVPSLLAAAFLLLATLDLPYGYYTFLRIVVCGVSLHVAYSGHQWGHVWAAWLFTLTAVLFNPLIPIHLDQQTWLPIDLIVAAAFVGAAISVRRPNDSA